MLLRPVRPVVALLVLTMLLTGLINAGAAPAAQASASDLLSRLNQLRVDRGLPALVQNSSLDRVAQQWTTKMASGGKLAHNPSLASQVPAGWTAIGENVAYGPSSAWVHEAWTDSPGHYANMTNKKFNSVGIGFVVVGRTAWATQVFAAYPGVKAPVSGTRNSAPVPTPDGTTIAVTGVNGELYSRSSGATRWTRLGGALLGAPAVHRTEAGVVHYVAQGTTGRLYHRTNTRGWHALAPAAARCSEPAVAAFAGTVTVGCRGGNRALYSLTFAEGNQHPYARTLRKLGGVLSDGPAVIASSAGPEFVVRGGRHASGNLYSRTLTDGYTRLDTSCAGRPAASLTDTTLTLACNWDGEAVLYERQGDAGERVDRLDGAIVGSPALAARGDGTQSVLFVQGTDGRIYHRTIAPGSTGSRWASIDAGIRGGVGASGDWTF